MSCSAVHCIMYLPEVGISNLLAVQLSGTAMRQFHMALQALALWWASFQRR